MKRKVRGFMKRKKYKKYFHALLATTVAVSTATVVMPAQNAEAYQISVPHDLHEDDYFYDAMFYLWNNGIINGFPDGSIRPYQQVTRGQATKILAGVLGLDTENVQNPGFRDVSPSNEYYGAIAALANAGIINGYPDGTFKINAPIQRNHMAKILALAFNIEPSSKTTTPFKDLNKEYEKYIKALYEYKITTGTTPTTFGGTSNVTRGQLALFVYRAEKNAPNVEFTVSDIAGDKVVVGNKQYKASVRLQDFFRSSNLKALKGAVIKGRIVNGQIVSINSINFKNHDTKAEVNNKLPILKVNGKENFNFTYGVKNDHFLAYETVSLKPGDTIEVTVNKGFDLGYRLYKNPHKYESMLYWDIYYGSPRVDGSIVTTSGPIQIFQDHYLYAIAVKDGNVVGELKYFLDVDENAVANVDPFPIIKINGKEQKYSHSSTKLGYPSKEIYIQETFASPSKIELIPSKGTTIYYWDDGNHFNYNTQEYNFATAKKYTEPIQVTNTTEYELTYAYLDMVVVKDNAIVGVFNIAIPISK